MRNSIFKSYSKKILKSEAFVSVIIVFVLAIGIISTSYALYMDVDKDTDYQLVQVGDLSIGFDKGDNTISLSNMTPSDDDIALTQTDNIFSFYIYNTGTYTADYNIKLVTTDGNEVDKQYINYKICKDNANNCKDIKTLSDVTDEIIYTDELAPKKSGDATNPSSYYFIRIWINNKYTDTTSKNIKLKVVVDATSGNTLLDNKNTLAGRILNDSRIKINNDTPDFTVAESEEKGLYKAPDDYGTTYYFRGAQSYNYVEFADKIWRIVRINGDGTIRLVFDEPVDKVVFNNNADDDNAYVGYMYGMTGQTNTNVNQCIKLNNAGDAAEVDTTKTTQIACEDAGYKWATTPYDATHVNVVDSNVKKFLDAWYKTNIIDTNNDDYIADTLFCGDKSLSIKNNYLGYGDNDSKYALVDKIDFTTNDSTPTLECAKKADDTYSRYTVNENILPNNNKTNGDLKYSIGLLSAVEVVFAGASTTNVENKSYYLNQYSSTSSWMTMTPYYRYPTTRIAIIGYPLGNLGAGVVTSDKFVVRPSINLISNVLVKNGDGTKEKPYTLKLY